MLPEQPDNIKLRKCVFCDNDMLGEDAWEYEWGGLGQVAVECACSARGPQVQSKHPTTKQLAYAKHAWNGDL